MEKTVLRYVDKSWSGDKSRYSIEQLLLAIPAAMRRYAKRVAGTAKRDITKGDCRLPYREPNGDININGISAALGRLNQVKGPSPAELASARGELESQRGKARKALGKPAESNNSLNSLMEVSNEFMSDMNSYMFAPAPVALVEPMLMSAPELETPEGVENPIGKATVWDGAGPGFLMQNLEEAAALAPVIEAPPMILDSHLSGDDIQKRMSTMLEKGVIENDFKPLPNFRALGIERPAGPATVEELKAFAGQTKADGTPVGVDDFFSVGAVLANIDVITSLMAYIPPVELARIGQILSVRSKKSDQDHSRKVMSGNFTVIDPLIGTDPDAKMHADHPLLGKVPYTALTARLLFPIMQDDPEQKAAVEGARRGKLQNLSIAFGYGGLSCGLCGEMVIDKVLRSGGNVIGFTIDPSTNEEFCQEHGTEDDYYYPMAGTLRMPVEMDGDHLYRNVSILKASADGTIQIDPVSELALPISSGSVFLMNLRGFWGYTFCRLHGFLGSTLRDGRKNIGMFTQLKTLMNVAAVDAGAIADARLCLDPNVNY